MAPTQSILVIDDDTDIGELIVSAATDLGMSCRFTADPGQFLDLLTPEISLVLLDLLMPEIDGIELLRVLGQQKCAAGIVLMSGMDTRVIETAEQLASALGLEIVGRLRKPFGIEKLERTLRKVSLRLAPTTGGRERVPITDDDLREAIRQEAFVLHFQPQIDLTTNQVVGFESLVRWLHQDIGVVYPDQFIERAESLALIDDLGFIVLRKGLQAWKHFADADGQLPHLSINVSAVSLRDLQLPDKVAALLREFDLPAHKLILEVTESGVLNDLALTLDVLARLRLKNIQLSVDDFGIGYSMLQQLRRIPANELKVDKSFVQKMLSNPGDKIVVQKTIEIGHELGMRMVAEGVETYAQLQYLRIAGCDVGQGYFFCRPRPLAIMLSWLQNHRRTAAAPFHLPWESTTV